MLYQREQYLAGEVTHRQYYAQFVNAHIKQLVKNYIGLEALLECNCAYLNTIPLRKWDAIFLYSDGSTYYSDLGLSDALRASGDSITPSGITCILKEAGRQLIEENKKGGIVWALDSGQPAL